MKLPDLPTAPRFLLWLLAVMALAGVSTPMAGAQTKPTPPAAAPSLTLNPQSVVATGVTPGGEVAWLAVERHPRGYYQDVVIHREVTLADITGQTQLDLPEAVAWKSIWLAVDLETGEAVGVVPDEYPGEQRPWSGKGLVSADGGVSQLTHPFQVAELLFVRPGVGAWVGQALDGKSGDAERGSDGQVIFELADLTALGKAVDAPSEVAEADTVIALDTARMMFSIGRVEGAGSGQSGSEKGGVR